MADSITADDLATCRECMAVVAAGSARQRTAHGLEEHGTAFVEWGPPGDADRLFVPLNTEPYRAFERGEKDVELRGVDARFNVDTVRSGRRVELRRGYSTDDSLWGEIGHVQFYHRLASIAWDKVERIDPEAVSRPHFNRRVADLLGHRDRYVAFEVVLDGQ